MADWNENHDYKDSSICYRRAKAKIKHNSNTKE